jgi:hypothetical protein
LSLSATLPKVHRIQKLREHRFQIAAARVETFRQALDVAREALARRDAELQGNQAAGEAVQAWLDSPRSSDLGGAPLARLEVLMDQRRTALQARIDDQRAVTDAEDALDLARAQMRRAQARLAAVDVWTTRLEQALRRERERRLQLDQESWTPSARMAR